MDFDHSTETITPNSSVGGLTINATGALTIPVGTTGQRPGSPVDGMIRYNSTEAVLDAYLSPYTLFQTPAAIQYSAVYRKRRYFNEEFLTGTTTINSVGLFGELGWTQTSAGTTANSIQTGVADHLGILRIGTGTTNGNGTRIHLGNAATTGIVMANQVEYFSFLIRIPTITSIALTLGLGQTMATSATFGTDGVFFTFNPATNATLNFITRSGSSSATAVATVTVAANTWYLIEAFYNGTTWTPVVNGVTYTAQSGNIPTSAVNVGAYVVTNTGSTRQLDLDSFNMITRELGVRY